MKIDIIGHCNVALGIILDILHSTQKNASITIISACNLDFYDKTTKIPYTIKDMDIQETTIETWKPNYQSLKLIASMDLTRRMEIFNNISKYLKKEDYDNIISPNAYLSNKINIGHGNLIAPLATLSPFARISDFTNIQHGANIGHHTSIGSFCNIAPGCNIAGYCTIKNNTVIGIGANILDSITIGNNVVIGAGCVVTKNVPDNSVYYGVPARFIRTNKKAED